MLSEIGRRLRLPRTLRWRLFLIIFTGLVAAHALSFGALFTERTMSARATMLTTLERDVGSSIALLDRLPVQERSRWLTMLDRPTYSYEIGAGLPGVPELSQRAIEIADTINEAAARRFPVRVESIPGDTMRLQAHVTLSDGSIVTIDILPALMPVASWLPYVLVVQICVLIFCSWLAVRLAIRPLLRLADAAEGLDPSRKSPRLDESGPTEVAYAATAFNAMRDRVTHYLHERVQILGAISHDLQTPITRMKLRAEMAEGGSEKDRLISDLSEIERLVRQGVAYAKSAQGDLEKPTRLDIGSFVESIAFDYQDIGKPLTVKGAVYLAVQTRPHALRRILTNLIDNALKFAGAVEIEIELNEAKSVRIGIFDRGPGIPPDQLEAVLQPFYRLEQSRNRDTGGTGLGLAIAQQLSSAIGATLVLSNRPGGGLAAIVELG
ncbi:MAG TPA: HAMP domain-containing sensor histidine kinase [Pseudolabrys sp.]